MALLKAQNSKESINFSKIGFFIFFFSEKNWPIFNLHQQLSSTALEFLMLRWNDSFIQTGHFELIL